MEVCVADRGEGASDLAWVGMPGIYEFPWEAGFLSSRVIDKAHHTDIDYYFLKWVAKGGSMAKLV
eukprot:2399464-Ditylum_brightwellii.AAC.2